MLSDSELNGEIPSDYKVGALRNDIRDSLVKISNKLYEKFSTVETPIEYDREVFKKIEAILRLYDALRFL